MNIRSMSNERRVSGSVLVPCGLASTDGVWQHDVKYMCKYSTTSFIDYFNKTEHVRSHRRISAAD
jgi:hypothetical protein